MKVYGFTISFVAWEFTQTQLKIEKCQINLFQRCDQNFISCAINLSFQIPFFICVFLENQPKTQSHELEKKFNAKMLFAGETKKLRSSIALVILRPIVGLHFNYTCIKHSLKSINYQLSRTFVCFKSIGSLEYIGASLEVK